MEPARVVLYCSNDTAAIAACHLFLFLRICSPDSATTTRRATAGRRLMAYPRATIMKRLRAKVEAGRPVVGAGAGTGISAKCEEVGGVDLIVVYNSGRFRMAGCGSLAGLLPYGSANQIVK